MAAALAVASDNGKEMQVEDLGWAIKELRVELGYSDVGRYCWELKNDPGRIAARIEKKLKGRG